MKTEWYAPLTAAFCLVLAYGSSVQPDGEPRSAALDRQIERIESQQSSSPTGLCKASQVLGRKIHNPQGEPLGDITDVVVDPEGRTPGFYVVMAYGGFLGMGEKLFVIPWAELSPSEDQRDFVLGVPREAFEKAQGLDDDAWPILAAETPERR